MVVEIKKTITKKYELVKANPFGIWGELKENRERLYGDKGMKGMYKCFCCQKPFKDEDHINICFVRAYKNVIVCDECAETINSSRKKDSE